MIVPTTHPEITQQLVRQLLDAAGVTEKVAVLGRRGYYRDTMGAVGKNDRGIYDDAIVIMTPTLFGAFNANTDPSAWRPGIASLKAGVWRYKIGIHGLAKPKDKQYLALVQADKVTVTRDGAGESTGFFGINIHRGGYGTTSSLGCQTIYPTQWETFIAAMKSETARWGVTSFPYVLTERS